MSGRVIQIVFLSLGAVILDYLLRHIYGYRLIDIFHYLFNVNELLMH